MIGDDHSLEFWAHCAYVEISNHDCRLVALQSMNNNNTQPNREVDHARLDDGFPTDDYVDYGTR